MLKTNLLATLTAVAILAAAPLLAHDGPHDTDGHWQLGELTISGAFARATLPNAPVAGGFVTVTNNGTQDDRLIAAQSPVAGRVEIHEMTMEGDVMRMRQLPDGLPIPAGQSVEMRPGGLHMMFMDLQQPLHEGETAPVNLQFESAGQIEIPLAIGPMNSRGADHDPSTADHMEH